jgi:hypothetical protein
MWWKGQSCLFLAMIKALRDIACFARLFVRN